MPIAAIERVVRDTKTIERLAEALDKASTLSEIKDIRDRAWSIQQYARRKESGLKAAQAAGRIVTEATLKLAELYHEEEGTPGAGGHNRKALDRDQEPKPGKKAIAEAADMDPAALSRLGPAVEATDRQRERAMQAIEERGEIVSPAALARELAPQQPPDLLRGRSEGDFRSATAALGAVRRIAEYVEGARIPIILRGCSDKERARLVKHAITVRDWMSKLIKESANE